MDVTLSSKAEERAKEAEAFRPFGGLNLLHIKRQVAVLLGLIGRNGIFDEYTRHDISHIDEMLHILDWLVPEGTWPLLSPTDCLIAVLGIYFHDAGMLVTRQEFERRNESGFPEFRDGFLFAGDEGTDYKEQVRRLPAGRQDRFLYQEFVRKNHAARVRNWIIGRPVDHLGVSHDALREVENLLAPLGQQFRRDLAVVCESHHLDDLADTHKYKVSQPYGNSDAETANLQYAAVLLRSCDLLHITSDRTPSIEFRTICPSDPISQREWAKQMAVNRVKPKLGLNREGLPDEGAPRDTLQVYAYFTSADAFFGLTSYLAYAQEQAAKSREWIEGTRRRNLARHEFPWRWIDETNVEAEGFLRDTFEFSLDQARILDLLTGHTLYNDTRVVLRELTQNSLDAIRLQQQITPAFRHGKVEIRWDSNSRELAVLDNGTGMTQDIITNFLLTVGSSRYQDEEFRKQFPCFSPISRFGIGVLSAFMIADTVEIVTCHPDESEARQLSLRSVHGKYLIRLLDKETEESARALSPHGTLFVLKVRPSADVPDVVQTAREWIVLPGCEVTVRIDNSEPVRIGHESIGAVLRSQLGERGYTIVEGASPPADERDARLIKVVEREKEGLSLAYALKWNRWFREWNFLQLEHLRDKVELIIGTCVGGIRVESGSPGYNRPNLAAVANAHGPNAPRTNVARYGLDDTRERDHLLSDVYSLYCEHIGEEIEHLRHDEQFSLTWATQEGGFLVSSLLRPSRGDGVPIQKPHLLREAIRDIPLAVVESGGVRSAVAISELHSHDAFWTIDCALFRSVEWFLREFPQDSSLRAVADAVANRVIELPQSLCSAILFWCGMRNVAPIWQSPIEK